MNKIKYLIFTLVICLLVGACLASCNVPEAGGSSSKSDASSNKTEISVPGGNSTGTEDALPDGTDSKGSVSGGDTVDSEDGSDESNGTGTVPSDSTESGDTAESSSTDSDVETDGSDGGHSHDFGSWNIIALPSCTEAGLQIRECECGEAEEKEIPAVGHSYRDWKETKPATCTEAGEEAQSCYCGDTVTRELEALGHDLDKNGACTRCDYCFAEKAIIISVDISSSMKEYLGGSTSGHSRFTGLIASLKAVLEEIDESTMIGIIAFDANLHLICEPRFLGPKGERQAVISEIEYILTHEYYRFYFDAQGNETNIPIGQNDGTKYTEQGYIKPVLSSGQSNGGYDRVNGYWIKTYGTAYLPPITYASQAFELVKAKEKSLVFVSDGEPMDKGSGYLEIIKGLSDKGIKTSTVCLYSSSTSSSTQFQELNAISVNGLGQALTATTADELTIALKKAMESIDSCIEVDENGFRFAKIGQSYYLMGYEGEDSDIVLPESYKGESYSLIAGSIDGVQSIHSITFPANITSIPSYAITNCKHLYTVKFLAQSQVTVNSNAFSGCIRIYETYGSYSGSLHNSANVINSHSHSSLEEESCVQITADGLVIGKTNYYYFDVIDYLGDEKSLRVEIPSEFISDIPQEQVRRYVCHYAFYETSLESISFEDGFNWVGQYAFASSTELNSVMFGEVDSRFDIYGFAFSGCEALEFLKVPVININGANIFENCHNAVIVCSDDLSIPSRANPLNRPVISNCTGLGYAENGLKWVTSSDFEGAMICGYIGEDSEVIIPNEINGVSVTSICDGAFAGLDFITKITIPDSVVSIGENAFVGCTNLIKNKEGILYVNGWVVGYEGEYTEIVLDDTAVGIASGAFTDNDSLITIVVPLSVKYLSKNAVIGCNGVTVCFEHTEALSSWTDGWNADNVPVVFNYCTGGHVWYDATCTKPKTCSVCGAPTGLPKGHAFENGSCTVCDALEIFDVTYNEWSGSVWETAVPNEDGTHTLRTTMKTTSTTSGFTFFGWVDDIGNLYEPGETVYFKRNTRLYEAYGKTVTTASELTNALNTMWSHTYIKLGADITLSSTINANATIALIDLNGYTLTSTVSGNAFYIYRGSFALVGKGEFIHQPSSVSTSATTASVNFRAHGYRDEAYPQVFRIGKDVTFTTPYNALWVNTTVLDNTPDILIAGKVTASAIAYITPVVTDARCEITKDAELNLSDCFITFANTTGTGNYMTITLDGFISVAGDLGVTFDDDIKDIITVINNLHTWQNATCTEPMTCTECGATHGEALGHQWKEATCENAKTCSVCGETEGEALGHDWLNNDCTKPTGCQRCDESLAPIGNHTWEEATCTEAKHCTVCKMTEGEALGHSYVNDLCPCGAWRMYNVAYCSYTGKVVDNAYANDNGTHTMLNYGFGYEAFYGWFDNEGNIYEPNEAYRFNKDTMLYELSGISVYDGAELKTAIEDSYYEYTIKLEADITVDSTIIADMAFVIIDLNGHTLTSTAPNKAFGVARGSFALIGEGNFVHEPKSTSSSSAATVFYESHGYGDGYYPQHFWIGKDVTVETSYRLLYVNKVVLEQTPNILISGTVSAKSLAHIAPVTTNAICTVNESATLTLSDDFITFGSTTGEGNYMTVTLDGNIKVAGGNTTVAIDQNISDRVVVTDNREFLDVALD